MSDNKTYHQLPQDPCLTQDQILGYLDGTLSPREQNTCERHMVDCEMCSDALEGLQLVKDRAILNAPLPAHPEKEEAKVIPLGKPNKRIWYAAAATVVIILGAAFLFKMMINNDETSLAENKASEIVSSDAPPPAIMDSGNSVATPEVSQNSAEQTLMKEEKLANTPDVVTKSYSAAEGDAAPEVYDQPMPAVAEELSLNEDEELPVAGNTVQWEDANKDADKKEQQESRKPGIVDKAKSAVAQGVLKKDAPKSNAQRSELSSGTTAPTTTQTTESRTDNYSGSPATKVSADDAVAQTDSVATQSPHPLKASDRDLELSYVNGLQLYNSGQYNAALVFFEEVLKNPSHTRYQDAEFQKANTLIKLNRKEEARVLLKSIEAKKGVHAAEATELLKTL